MTRLLAQHLKNVADDIVRQADIEKRAHCAMQPLALSEECCTQTTWGAGVVSSRGGGRHEWQKRDVHSNMYMETIFNFCQLLCDNALLSIVQFYSLSQLQYVEQGITSQSATSLRFCNPKEDIREPNPFYLLYTLNYG